MKVTDCIFCEDIREESSGRKMLLGIHNSQLLFKADEGSLKVWPQQIKLGLFMRIKVEEADLIPSAFRCKVLHNGKPVAGLNFDISEQVIQVLQEGEDTILTFAVNFSVVEIPGPGALSVNLELLRHGDKIFYESPDCKLVIDLQRVEKQQLAMIH